MLFGYTLSNTQTGRLITSALTIVGDVVMYINFGFCLNDVIEKDCFTGKVVVYTTLHSQRVQPRVSIH